MSPSRLCGFRSAGGVAALFFLSLPASAQETRVISPTVITPNNDGSVVVTGIGQTPTVPGGAKITNLKQGLDQTIWNAAQKGPLITFDPENVQAGGRYRNNVGGGSDGGGASSGVSRPLSPAASSTQSYGLTFIADYFNRRVVPLNTVTVVAPAQMVVLRAPTKKLDPFATLNRGDKLKMLMGSLNRQQWQQLCGEQGLSAGDLPGEQKALMLSLLPDPFTVMPVKSNGFNGYSYSRNAGEPDRRVNLAGAARAGIRLRLNMVTQMTLPALDKKRPSMATVNPRPPDTEYFTLANAYERFVPPGTGDAEKLKETLPNRLKQGQINFASPSLDARISLKGAKTLDDLVRRVAAATRLECFADTRVAVLPVWIRGEEQSARSGDVLQALCWGITGAFRKVGTAYLLTDDVEGIGARRMRISEAARASTATLREWQLKMDERIRKTNAVENFAFKSDDILKPDEKTLTTIKEKWNTARGRYEGVEIPVEKLTPEQKARVQEAVTNNQEMMARFNYLSPVATDRVRVSTTPRLAYVVPGVGEVEANNLGYVNLNSFLPPPTGVDEGQAGTTSLPKGPVKLPAQPIGGVLIVAPTTMEQAKQFVQTAKEHQFRQVWVSVSMEKGAGADILAAAVAAGKVAGVPVSAVVPLMFAPADTTPDRLDKNILGETSGQWAKRMRESTVGAVPNISANTLPSGDWLFPDTASVMARLRPRLREVASVPGLAGIVFRDTAAPGYGLPDTGYFFTGNLAEFGYTEEMRLALIRRVGCDPLDVITDTQYGNYQYALPFFPDAPQMRVSQVSSAARKTTTPKMAWNALRFERTAQLLGQVHGFMKAEFPNLSLMIRDLTGSPYSGWYGSWEKADGLPRASIFPSDSGREAWVRSLRQKTPKVVFNMAYTPDMLSNIGFKEGEDLTPESVTKMTSQMNAFLMRETSWDGYVFDFSGLPAETTLLMVKNVFAASASPSSPAKTTEQRP